ncbi:hypothetical protein WHR41_07990 [Cladosporium halotolerans]|uniref:SnoaL-like domain-containing protein n=1 Tax=Cladosporium halotolerans TaxID=1052096 RepID=A0AB34KDM6_9PEZI
MRPFAPQLARFTNRTTASSPIAQTAAGYFSSGYQSSPSPPRQNRMASTETGELKLETTDVKTAPGVDLSSEQRTLVASVLDLFAGRPSLAKLQLWKDDGEFSDPITMAKGRKQYEAQWYGLQTAFSEIERKSHNVTSAGNPISMDLTTRYKVKGVGKETTINSKINIFTDGGKIQRVEDKWDGKLPDSSITNAFRRLNAVSVPKMVGVPNNAEEDAKRGN